MEGKEWESATDPHGVTTISVNVNFSTEETAKLTKSQITDLQKEISTKFNEVLDQSSKGMIKGKITFSGGSSEEIGQIIPDLALYGQVAEEGFAQIGGMNTFASTSVNVLNKKGEIRTFEEIAEDAVHELLHTVRLTHPFEKTQGNDTRLIRIGKREENTFRTTKETDKNIQFNIMNYPHITVDGQGLRGLWETRRPILLTNDQINLILEEINLQKAGAGMPNSSTFFDYWINTPGEDVKSED